MRHLGSRKINVRKYDLINQIKVNKDNHIKEYEKAVVAYKTEALKQLNELLKKVEQGELKASLNLITPINNAENYDKIIAMFEWEVNPIVELEQSEFNEYVLDETDFAIMAKTSNMSYLK